MEAVLAIDLGATSGRAIVGYLSENKLVMEEINRFSNPVSYTHLTLPTILLV